VVLVHANYVARAGISTWWPGGVWGAPFFALAVPVFLVLSAYAAAPAPARGGFARHAWRRARRLLPPLLFWGAALVAIGYRGRSDWLGLLADLATGPWHLYYVVVLLQFFVVAYWLEALARPGRLAWTFASAAVLSALVYGGGDVLLWTRGGDGGAFEYWLQKLLPTWSVFLATGVGLRRRPDLLAWLRRRSVALVLAVVPLYLGYVWEFRAEEAWLGYYPREKILGLGLPFQWAGSLLLLVLLDRAAAAPAWAPALARLSRASRQTYAVYLAHPPALVVLFTLGGAAGLSMTHWAWVPLLAAGAWALAWALWRLVGWTRWRPLEWLVFGGVA
jgi:fucose 4-O-acetylase-like acetyltransferase